MQPNRKIVFKLTEEQDDERNRNRRRSLPQEQHPNGRYSVLRPIKPLILLSVPTPSTTRPMATYSGNSTLSVFSSTPTATRTTPSGASGSRCHGDKKIPGADVAVAVVVSKDVQKDAIAKGNDAA